MVVHFLLAFDTVKCRFIRPGRIHLLRNKKERFKEKALEKVRIKSVSNQASSADQNALCIYFCFKIKLRKVIFQ